MGGMRIQDAVPACGARVAAWAIAALLAVFAAACAAGDATAPAPSPQAGDAGGTAGTGTAAPERGSGGRQAAGESLQLLPRDAALLARLRIAEEDDGGIDYVRRDYDQGGWAVGEDDCSTRERVLIAEAIRLRGRTERCSAVDGAWLSWYDGRTLTDVRDMEIDHMVPLAEAHRSGAAGWAAALKAAFANDLSNPHSLAAVSARSNRDKRDSDPAAWRPPAGAAWCRYARNWISVKAGWGLAADPAEAAALREMLGTCAEGGGAEPAERPVRAVRIFPYATCDEADAAGLERRRGPRGPSRGFPVDQVAYARDGDGDGIVCER